MSKNDFCCEELVAHLGDPNRTGAGLHALVPTSITTGKTRVAAVYLMPPGARQINQGTVVKWCPFCGANLIEKHRVNFAKPSTVIEESASSL